MATIAVALSGGVDSTVTAYFLEKEGWNLVGASHEICRSRTCNDETLGRAGRFCSQRGLPYYRLHLESEFRSMVIDDFIGSYIGGRTPNPCIRCNERIRFTLFYGMLREILVRDGILRSGEPLFFATGHYARIMRSENGFFIRRGADRSKDQSYMLYRIPRHLLPFLVFPLGGMTKKEVVAIARERGFPSASVRESQDICFIEGEYHEFLKNAPETGGLFVPGAITDTAGRVLGAHEGYLRYTPGQRKGLGLADGPWYVVSVIPSENRVVVGRRNEVESLTAVLEEPNWFIDPPDSRLECTINLRYQSRDIPCTVQLRDDGTAEVLLSSPALVSPGQSGVLYRDDLVLGGGILAAGPGTA